MTEQYTQSKNRFYVEDANPEFEDLDESDPEINKIVVTLLGVDEELHMYPRNSIREEKEVNGMKGFEDKDVPYRVSNLPQNLADLVRGSNEIADEQVIVVDGTVQVNQYDNGDVVYRMWDNMIESDSFSLDVIERPESISANPADRSKIEHKERAEELMQSEDETAEEVAEQEVGDSDEKSEDSEELEAGDELF